MSAKNDLAKIIARLKSSIKASVSRPSMTLVGKFAVELVKKRTRLGYGVSVNFGAKQRLLRLSPKYIESRKRFNLHGETTPKRSNLTRTGQMLDSVQIISMREGSIVIGPRGPRTDGKKNEKIAEYQAKQGRIFNRVSALEFKQILRFYRREFGDLLKKKNLIR